MLRYLFNIWVLMAGIFLFSSCTKEQSNTSNASRDAYLYTFHNPSLGPVNGRQKVTIIINGNTLVSATDLRTKKPIGFGKIRGIEVFKKALNHQNDGLSVRYLSANIPEKIIRKEEKGHVGGGFTITLIKQ